MSIRSVSRITPFLALLPSLLLGASLAACSDEGGLTGPPDPPPIPVIDSARVFAFANTAENRMQGLLHTVFGGQQLGTPNPFLLPTLGAPRAATSARLAAAASACAPVQTGVDTNGVAIDTDVDGIPDDNTVDFGAGCSVMDGGLEFTFSGKYRLRDPGGGIMDWEYTTTALAARVRDTVTGDFIRQQVNGSESAHFSAAHAAHQMDVTLDVRSGSGADSTHVTLRTLTASTYDPSGGSSFQLHGSLPQGTFALAAELVFRDIAVGADSQRFVITTPTPIHTAFACDSGIDGGVLEGLFEGDERVGFQFTWPGCSAPFIQVFGTTP
ncbi:MAG TPA: hypothetical protein VG940_11475 [Gemmatimonadales bacterium]|nr:hypothetical protein [Gemmatimonadales bacterium]